MSNRVSNSVGFVGTPYSQLPVTESKGQGLDLVKLVENMQSCSMYMPSAIPAAVAIELDTASTIPEIMNLIPIRQKCQRTQYMAPETFFQQLGCSAPAGCKPECLQGFYQLVDSYKLSNCLSILDFLAFDVFTNLKSIEASCKASLKPKIQEKIDQWSSIRAKVTYTLIEESLDLLTPGEGIASYIRDFKCLRAELLKILEENKQDCSSANVNKRIEKIAQNYNFTIQFLPVELQGYLVRITLDRLSGTKNIQPKIAADIPKALKNLQMYAEFMIRSKMIKLTDSNFPRDVLDGFHRILSDFNALTSIDNKDELARKCNILIQELEKQAIQITGKTFSIAGVSAFPYKPLSGTVTFSFLRKQLGSQSENQKKMGLKFMDTVDVIYDLMRILDISILLTINPEHVYESRYVNRSNVVFNSMCSELLGLLNGQSGHQKSTTCKIQDIIEDFKFRFNKKILEKNFFERALDYRDSYAPDSQMALSHYSVKHLYEVLKPLTENTLQSLIETCADYSDEDIAAISLFEETDWLAKALLLVHDWGMILKDPDVKQEIEFHPDYIKLIRRLDPSIRWEEAEPKISEPVAELDLAVFGADNFAESKKEPVAPVTVKPHPKAKNTPQPSLPAVALKPNRKELRDELRGAQGDLRQMSRVLRSLLGSTWNITHDGKRHPTIRDGECPIAPIPSTGHAGLGTILGVVGRVCDAAEAKGLLRKTDS